MKKAFIFNVKAATKLSVFTLLLGKANSL